ncbi:hypothetical protein JGS39_10260 [Streptomyces sp. P01-B04]|uniref:hypothetical protein n=1 Tax=Streptomyces poriferorum TaxID=2798799 RepID=UPI001C5CDF4F|nr:hypothetical protein [Streptomyces poriferorum]MBW5249380.1 hypothetical protein [Streptomyces poriferorum]MBW5255337.1 hypothetical protein [Streptomyces poriferorum]
MNSAEITPAAARSRARLVASGAAFLILSPFITWLLALVDILPDGTSVILAVTAGLAGFLLLQVLCEETGLVQCSMSRVTARTLTGVRMLDLTSIRDVRLLTSITRGGRTSHAVVVRDSHGVRVGLTSVRSQRALVRALQRTGADEQAAPSVSAAASAHLGLGDRWHRAVHTIITLLLQVLVLALYVALVLGLARLQ